MAKNPVNKAIQQVRDNLLEQETAGLSDGQLLGRFVEHQDEAAFSVLVRRLGPMVLGVCRRILGDHHEAEDAFQATFLVLVRKAAVLRAPALLANWLYGVAYHTALKARALAGKRRARERQVMDMPEPVAAPADSSADWQPLLDRELARLPDRYRVPIVLCDLEGKSRVEVARALGCPEGTLSSRLARARALLAGRLARRGVVLSSAALAVVLAEKAAAAGVPAVLVSNTVMAATLLAAGQAAGAVSPAVAALTEGVLKAMLLSKLKKLTAVLAALVVAAVACAAWAQGQANDPGEEVVKAPARTGVPPGEKQIDKQKTTDQDVPVQKGGDDVIRPGDRLQVDVPDTLPNRPIKGVFRVEPGGTVALGPGYGRVRVAGLDLQKAETVLANHLGKILKDVEVSVTRYDATSDLRVQALEARVQQLEKDVRALRATVEQLRKPKGL